METNKKLQNLIGNAINKDYFKLEFGQKINIRGDKNATFIKYDKEYINWLDEEGDQCDEDSANLKDLDFEILGQEPTLNDVLLAIGNIPLNHHYIDDTGRVFEWADDEFCKFTYNLEKSIFNQEEEVKVAIINLLEGK